MQNSSGQYLSSEIADQDNQNFPLWIELARDLDYLSLEEYPWIPFSFLTIAIWDRLEIPVLLFVIFHFAAYPESGSIVSCAYEGLDYLKMEAFSQNYSEAK